MGFYYKTREETYDRYPRIPTQMEGLYAHTMECGLVPSGGAFTTLLLLYQCNAAFSTILSTLVWADQIPVSQLVP